MTKRLVGKERKGMTGETVLATISIKNSDICPRRRKAPIDAGSRCSGEKNKERSDGKWWGLEVVPHGVRGYNASVTQ